jgi:hypothetical protein
MSDDWRLRIDLHEYVPAHELSDLLGSDELEHDLERGFQDRVVVSVEAAEVFCYAGTRDQAERAEQLIRRLAAEHGWDFDVELAHWHPVAERWENPDQPLPGDGSASAEEHAERIAAEREQSAQDGYPEFEVRVQCAGRAEAAELADRLDADGIPHLHRWSYVLIGATDEDSAKALAERMEHEAPPGSIVTTELNQRFIYENRPWSPFTVLGGLAG